jgi:hypothetical protein
LSNVGERGGRCSFGGVAWDGDGGAQGSVGERDIVVAPGSGGWQGIGVDQEIGSEKGIAVE